MRRFLSMASLTLRCAEIRPKTEPVVQSEISIRGYSEQIVSDNKLAVMS